MVSLVRVVGGSRTLSWNSIWLLSNFLPKSLILATTRTPASTFSREEAMRPPKHATVVAPDARSRADDFAATFFALKQILTPLEKYLHVSADTRARYYLETRSASYKGRPLFFGAVVSGRSYVSFYLMPLYWDPSLLKKVSPRLKERMQGNSCFNFTVPDPVLFRELSKLTSAGLALLRTRNLL
jgi:hypothetical protein